MTIDEYNALTGEQRQALKAQDPLGFEVLAAEYRFRNLAAQASPGPWYRSHGCITASAPRGADGKLKDVPYWNRFLFNVERNGQYVGTEADARWVCAADPVAVVKLLDLVQKLYAEVKALKENTPEA